MKLINIYRISQDINNTYETYDSAIVCAESVDEARKIHPSGEWTGDYREDEWVKREEIDEVKVEYIGKADKTIKKGVVLSSFNSG